MKKKSFLLIDSLSLSQSFAASSRHLSITLQIILQQRIRGVTCNYVEQSISYNIILFTSLGIDRMLIPPRLPFVPLCVSPIPPISSPSLTCRTRDCHVHRRSIMNSPRLPHGKLDSE